MTGARWDYDSCSHTTVRGRLSFWNSARRFASLHTCISRACLCSVAPATSIDLEQTEIPPCIGLASFPGEYTSLGPTFVPFFGSLQHAHAAHRASLISGFTGAYDASLLVWDGAPASSTSERPLLLAHTHQFYFLAYILLRMQCSDTGGNAPRCAPPADTPACHRPRGCCGAPLSLTVEGTAAAARRRPFYGRF